MGDVTEDGLPILKKPVSSSDTTEDGLPILKKKEPSNASPNGSPSSGSGSKTSPATPPLTGKPADNYNLTKPSLSMSNEMGWPGLTSTDDRAHNPHTAAVKTAQAMHTSRGAVPKPDTTDPLAVADPKRSIAESISQAMYLPAFNQGFNDLVVKPAAGATDFIDRTIDKAYTSITGEKTPDWLRKKGAFDKLSKSYEDAYQQRDKPTNVASDIAEGTIGTLPLMASLFTGEGEASLATKLPNFFTKATKLLATTGALKVYKDATDNKEGYGQSLNTAAIGGLEGAKQGLELEAQMMVAGAFGKGVANQLAEKGILKGGKAGEAVLHALATGTVFGGTSAGNDLLNGKDINTQEAMKQFGMGLAFEAIPVANALKREIGDRWDASNEKMFNKWSNDLDNEDILSHAAQAATMQESASNMNAESALRTLFNTPKDHLIGINENIPGTHEDLYAKSIEEGAKAYDATDPNEKRTHYGNQMLLKTQADVKNISAQVTKDPQPLLDAINESDELTPEHKEELIGKVTALNKPKSTIEPLPEESIDEENKPVKPKENEQPEQTTPPVKEDVPGNEPQGVPAKANAETGNTEVKEVTNEQASFPEPPKGETTEKAEPISPSGENGDYEKLRQKAIDAITHGVIVPEQIIEGDPSGRFDLGMTTAEKKKAVADVTKGNYDTAPAKKLIGKLMDFDKNGDYPIIDGLGGRYSRSRGATPEEIQQHIDDAKAYKLSTLIPEDDEDVNKAIKELGITHEDFENYEQYRESGADGQPAQGDTKDVPRPEDDKGAGDAQSPGSKEPQGTPREETLKSELKDIDSKMAASEKGGAKDYLPYSERLKLQARKDEIEKELNPPEPKSIIKAAGGVLTPPYAQEFFEHDVKPTLERIAGGTKDALKWIVNTLSPKTGVSNKAIDTITKNLNGRNEAAAALDKAVGTIEKMFDKMKEPERVDFIDRIKRGIKQPTKELQDIADMYKQLDKDLYDEVAKHKGALPFKEDHFRVLWEKIPGSTNGKERKLFGLARRPLEGSKGFMKKATLLDMSEGMAKGGVPVSTNPMTLFKLANADAMKFITASRMFDALKDDGFVKFVKSGQDVPDGFVKINDKIANVYFPVKEGLVKTGEYYIEENAGRLVNNHLSVDHIRSGSVGRGLMEIKNLYTAAELGLSGYHASAIALEGVSSDIGRGLRKMVNLGLRGDYKMAGEGIMDILKAPFSPKITFSLGRSTIKLATVKDFENSDFGKKFLKANPEAEQYIHDFFMGGGLMKQSEDLKAQAFKGLKEQAGKDNYIGAALRAIPALNEMVMSPLFDRYIPAMKVGMFMKEFPLALEEQKGRIASGKTTREAIARKTISFIDDRLGEMNFDNLFWDRTFKTASQLMLRSVTWKLGNLRAMGGAPVEQAQEFYNAAREKRAPLLEPKLAWVFGLATMQVALAGVTQYMFTGTYPKTIKDLIAPRIDNKDDKQRVILPTYVKDVMHLSEKGPVDYAKSSLSGDVSKLADVWSNSDFQKYQIYSPGESLWENTKDITGYVLPKPISISNVQKSIKQGDSKAEMAMSFFGLNKAPKYLTEPLIENKIFDLYNIHEGVKSKGQKEQADVKNEIKTLYKRGKVEDAEKLANESIERGLLKRSQIAYLKSHKNSSESAAQYFFTQLPDDDKVHLYNQMSEQERKEFDPHGKVAALAKKQEAYKQKTEKPFSILGN